MNNEWKEYIQYGKESILNKDEKIKSNQDSIYFLSDGLIKISYDDDEVGEVFICIVTPGNIFNEVPFFAPHDSLVTFKALNTCKVTEFDRKSFEKIVIKDVNLLYSIIRSTAYKMSLLALTRKERSKKSNLKKNICRLIYDIAAYYRFENTVCPEVTQTDIASMFNVHRSRVNMVLNQLHKEGIIGKFTKKNLSIFDYAKLLALAELN